MATIHKALDAIIEDVETEGAVLEMAIDEGQDRTNGARKRLKRLVALAHHLKKAKQAALESGV